MKDLLYLLIVYAGSVVFCYLVTIQAKWMYGLKEIKPTKSEIRTCCIPLVNCFAMLFILVMSLIEYNDRNK